MDEGPHRLFPTELLVGPVPQLLRDLAAALGEPAPGSAGPVHATLTRLARLRRDQGYAAGEILTELSLPGETLHEALAEEIERAGEAVSPALALRLGERLDASLLPITAVTAEDHRERSRLWPSQAASRSATPTTASAWSGARRPGARELRPRRALRGGR